MESNAAFLPVILMKSGGETMRELFSEPRDEQRTEEGASKLTSDPPNLMTESATTSGTSFEAWWEPELQGRQGELEGELNRWRRKVGIG